MLSQRLAAETITTPDPSITGLLLTIAKRYPQIFFKPLFLCAASNKELIIANYLRILITLSAYLPNILTSNAEMMSVALMGNLSNTRSGDETSNPAWEQARLGHCVVMVELMSRLRTLRKSTVSLLALPLRRSKLSNFIGCCAGRACCIRHFTGISVSYPARGEGTLQKSTKIQTPVVKSRQQERSVLIPFSQRALYCMLFHEMRLITRSLKP